MNSAPFSIETQFLPEDAQEDKIDLEIGTWDVFDIDLHEENVLAFKQFMSSPPDGSEDKAWPTKDAPAIFGAFFCRPGLRDIGRKKLSIRKQALIHPDNKQRQEPPLCGGHCLFYRNTAPLPVTGDIYHRAKLRLSLNLQRFIRHQPQQDNPLKPWKYRLQKRREKRSSYGNEEISLDGEDNWIPDTAEWRKFAAREHLGNYIELVEDQFASELTRATKFVKVLNKSDEEDWYGPGWELNPSFALQKVETFWEFPSENPILDALEIGSKLMHFTNAGGKVTNYEVKGEVEENKEISRVYNSPCFSLPIAENVILKLYAKTNKRIRFEIVHTKLRKQQTALLSEAGILPKDGEQPWENIPALLRVLRKRAAEHMNDIMAHLRVEQAPNLVAKSVVELLSEIANAAPPSIFQNTRVARIQTLLIWLCYYRGYRGDIKKGVYAPALAKLKERGVLKFDKKRQFYVLTDAYKQAADALIASTGDPSLTIFGDGIEAYQWSEASKMPVRLRGE